MADVLRRRRPRRRAGTLRHVTGKVRRFVVIGKRATASGDFSLDDVAGTSGRLDVGLRCVRAALLTSHKLRRDVVVYLALYGGPRAPRVVRIRGGEVRFLRPDERSLAVLARKVLAQPPHPGPEHTPGMGAGFVEMRPGIDVAAGGVERVLADLGGATPYVLEEGGRDIRDVPELGRPDVAFFLGDESGFDDTIRAQLAAAGARPVSVGPVSVHAEDAIAIVSNELDRREKGA
jgi:tRNA (pseudouridine54-N1)-methyltransferase